MIPKGGDAQPLVLGSRASMLALVQTRQVKTWLEAAWPHLRIDILTFSTEGDRRLEIPLHQIGEKGLFTQELEMALLNGQIDAAVHSAKDLPGVLPDGLSVVPVGPREDPRDVVISLRGETLECFGAGSTIATSSLRRNALLRQLRPDLRIQPIRGNLQTRMLKLRQGQADALILAAAGVHRLDWQARITQYLDPFDVGYGAGGFVPAVGQGILAVEYANPTMANYCAPLVEAAVSVAWRAERAFLQTVEGGCQVPMGAYASQQPNGLWRLIGLWPDSTGKPQQATQLIDPKQPEQAGIQLAQHLLTMGKASV